jgi:hypothetical protein
LPRCIKFIIIYKGNQPDINIKIDFKNKVNVLGFFEVGAIRCEINLTKKNILLTFNLSKNGFALGSHTIQLDSKEKVL